MNRAVCRMSRICSPGMPEMMLVLWPLPCRGQMLQYLYCIAGLREGGREGGRRKAINFCGRTVLGRRADRRAQTERKGEEGMQRFFTANDDDDRRAFVGGFLWPRPQPASPRLSFRFARDKFVVGKKGGEDMGGKFESSLSFLFDMELNEFHDCRLS